MKDTLQFCVAAIALILAMVSILGEGILSADGKEKADTGRESNSESMRVRELFIVNKDNRIVCKLHSDEDGRPRIELFDSKGESRRIMLGVGQEVAGLQLADESARTVCSLVSGRESDTGLELVGADENVIAQVVMDKKSSPSISLHDKKGVGRVVTMVSDDGAAGMAILDKHERVRILNQVDKDGAASVHLRNSDGTSAQTWKSEK